MSVIVTTDLGRFRRAEGAPAGFLFECPCGEWLPLTLDMMEGRTSVDHASQGCPKGYHETHRYDIELVARMQMRVLDGRSPVDPESADA